MALEAAIADELAIRNLVARYADGVNRRDADAWGATWAEDGQWHLLGNDITGREAIVQTWRSAMGGFESVLQLVHSGVLEIDGDKARGRWYLTEIGRQADGGATLAAGVYHDECVRGAAGWLFARRRFDLLYQGAPDLSGRFFGFPAL